MGMGMITEGQTPLTLSLGVASFNLANGEWRYLGKEGNSASENIGYGLGALANMRDINLAINSTNAQLVTEGKGGGFPHSAVIDEYKNPLMSFGPNSESKVAPLIGKVKPTWLQKGLNTLRFGFESRLNTTAYNIDELLIKWSVDLTL